MARWERVKHFVVYVVAFSCGTWANMKVLMLANVETVIVFRSCAPLCVSVMDYVFHNRALPSRRSLGAMGLIALGASCYVTVVRRSTTPTPLDAYGWILLWFVLLIFQLTYGKALVTGLGLQSIWSPVLYTNALAIVPTALLGHASGDFARLGGVDWTVSGTTWLVVSCAAGIGISWAGFKCQSVLTATAYTVIGVMNKLVTVLFNAMLWDKHASPVGILCLAVCLGGGALYQQAPCGRRRRRERRGGGIGRCLVGGGGRRRRRRRRRRWWGGGRGGGGGGDRDGGRDGEAGPRRRARLMIMASRLGRR